MPNVYGPYDGIVDLAHSGDKVNVLLDLGFDFTYHALVCVKGITAPGLSTLAGEKARDFAQGVLTTGTEVFVSSFRWDKPSGRIDGDILFVTPYLYNGVHYEDFAQLMLASGNADVFNP